MDRGRMVKKQKTGALVREISAAAAAAAPIEAEQLDMLPATRFDPGEEAHERLVAAIKRDKRGRPPGAENVATREMKAFVLKVFGDPLLWRFRYLNHTPETLAKELNCTRLEAYDRLDKLAADLARLFYGQMAAVDSAGNTVVPRLTMMFGGQDAPALDASGRPRAPWEYLDVANAETQQNQALLASADQGSHGQGSHDPE